MTDWDKAAGVINEGGVMILPTDTIYGIVGQALNIKAVRRIHKIKERSANKPFIILISSTEQLSKLGISMVWVQQTKEFWPGPNSIIFPVGSNVAHLTCGLTSLAVRMPDNSDLLNLINRTGPLVAPSANPEGLEPAKNIDEAKKYFGSQVDFYLDAGTLNNPPSKLINISTGQRLR